MKLLRATLHKMLITPQATADYSLCLDKNVFPLQPYLGQPIALRFSGIIHCLGCGRETTKSYSQGYCFSCSQRLARCDLCIVRPERCHYHLGTCREPQWGQAHCMQLHIVYLANSSGVKVGITRLTQLPTRWLDQGATQAMAVAMVNSRWQAGQIETLLAKQVADKTDWRKLLKGEPPTQDLPATWMRLQPLLQEVLSDFDFVPLPRILQEVHTFRYPVLQYPSKVQALNPHKTPLIKGTLLGLKGQYWILDCGVLNIRKFSGYEVLWKIS